MSEILGLEQGVEEVTAEEKGDNNQQNISNHSFDLLLEPFAALEIENAEGEEGECG